VKVNIGMPFGLELEIYCAVLPVLVIAIMPSALMDSAKFLAARPMCCQSEFGEKLFSYSSVLNFSVFKAIDFKNFTQSI